MPDLLLSLSRVGFLLSGMQQTFPLPTTSISFDVTGNISFDRTGNISFDRTGKIFDGFVKRLLSETC